MSEKDKSLEIPYMEETMPHQISSPSFKDSNMKMQPPFVNEHGVVIGDSKYNSEESPLNNWSDDIDPAIMAGDQWVHPTNDIGWNSSENRELIEKSKSPKASPLHTLIKMLVMIGIKAQKKVTKRGQTPKGI